MNKLYVPTLALALVGGSVMAQTAQRGDQGLSAKKFRHPSVRTGDRPQASGAREIIWSDDFSDPATWVLGTVAGASADSWVIGTDAPSGAFAIDPLESTSAANGFAMFDSDLLCSGNQEAFVRMANPVDLSGYPGVVLEFEQLFRRFRGDCFVDVSTDGGTTWTETEVNAEVAVNDDTGNPDLEQINLSALAGGQSQVWIRFRYFSTIDVHGNGGGCDYAWMVDDVAFVTLPDFEIEMEYGYASTTGQGEEYGRIPQAQLPGTLNVGAGVFNFGGLDQSNIVVTSSFSGPTAINNVVATIPSLPSQQGAFTDDDLSLPPLATGEYTVNFTMTSDQIANDLDPDNNSAIRNFEVTNDIYSLDKVGEHAAGVTDVLQQVGTASFTDNSQDLKLMTMYFVNAEMTVYGMQVAIGPASRAGGTISISVLDTADVLATPSVVNLPVNGIESDVYTITTADVTRGFIDIAFPEPLVLDPGAYYACVNLGGSGTNTNANDAEIFVIDDLTVPQPGLAAAIYIAVDFNDDGTEGPHFYGGNGTAWAIRLSSNPNIGVREQDELAGVSVFPNPSKGVITVSTVTSGLHTVEVMNMLGELVMATTITGTTAMDLSTLSDGVYSIRVAHGGRTKVERVVLN